MVEPVPGKPQTRRHRPGSKGGGRPYVVRTLRGEMETAQRVAAQLG
jgi:hypothetical protein